MENELELEPQQQDAGKDLTKKRPLGVVLDIDGTLIMESRHLTGIRIRPYAISFLAWCRQRGYRLSLWTAGHRWWADRVIRNICPLVQQELYGKNHDCPGCHCSATFDFVWDGDHLRQERPLTIHEATVRKEKIMHGILPNACHWCEFYSHNCIGCNCFAGPNECNCRYVKDLRKLWWNQRNSPLEHFIPERTLMIENKPQNCRYNYGNAIYVPTYRGSVEDRILEPLQRYVEQVLEPEDVDVRTICKCDHANGPHACYRQSWWPS